jgi:hypothetical protein
MIARSPESRALPVALPLRLAAALLGGYAFVWGFVTLGIASLSAFGMGYDDAWMLMMMLAFLVYLGAILWAFAARSLLRVWLVFGAGAAAMSLAALWLAG